MMYPPSHKVSEFRIQLRLPLFLSMPSWPSSYLVPSRVSGPHSYSFKLRYLGLAFEYYVVGDEGYRSLKYFHLITEFRGLEKMNHWSRVLTSAQHPHDNSQAPITRVPRDLMPSSGTHGHCMHVVHRHTCRQNIYTLK